MATFECLDQKGETTLIIVGSVTQRVNNALFRQRSNREVIAHSSEHFGQRIYGQVFPASENMTEHVL